jgi:hypothetical protein
MSRPQEGRPVIRGPPQFVLGVNGLTISLGALNLPAEYCRMEINVGITQQFMDSDSS